MGLTSGTVKLTAIFSQGRISKTRGLLEEVLVGVPGAIKQCRCQRSRIGVVEMIRWRRSTREGSIYRTERAGADLTYLFATSVKLEGARVDMVTVRTVIKGLCR